MRWSAALLLGAMGCVGERGAIEGNGVPQAGRAPATWEESTVDGLTFELRDGQPSSEAPGSTSAAQTTTLSDADTRALLARAPALETDPGDAQSFAKRDASKPPPRTGAKVELPFPAKPQAAPDAGASELSVLRFAPEGPVPMAPHLSVTFSLPMVAVTSQEQASEVRPVQLDPEPPGQWRWLGTRTLLFEGSERDRLPMATRYTVTVPEGTPSATGVKLAEATSFSFETPAVKVLSSYPLGGPHRTDLPVFLGFDQAIDPVAISEFVTLVGGRTSVPLQAATQAQIDADPTVARLVQNAEPGRYLVLAPESPLPAATTFTLTLKKGAPSAEGPLRTTADQTSTFRTYEPLKLVGHDCWKIDNKLCNPDGQLNLELNNPLDPEVFEEGSVTVQPEVKDLAVATSGSWVSVGGLFAPNTSYTVTLPARLQDSFGQTLGRSEQVVFQTGPREPRFSGPGPDFIVLDPAARPVYPVYTVNHDRMRVRIFAATPDDFTQVSHWMREWRYDGSMRSTPPLNLLVDEVRKVDDATPDVLVESSIDLAPYLKDGKGNLFVWVEPQPQKKERWEQVHLIAWVQATDIGLSTFVDQQGMVAWASSLTDGAPLEGVSLAITGREAAAVEGTTGKDGLGRLALRTTADGPHVLRATLGDDTAFLPERWGWWNDYGGWYSTPTADVLRWFVFDDRHMYRPGETVSVKGWLRAFDSGVGGDLYAATNLPKVLSWRLRDAQGNEIGQGTAPLSSTGGFDLTFELPKTPALGDAVLDLQGGTVYPGDRYIHRLQIQEFRRPEFEVSVAADPRPVYLGETAEAWISASYFAGGSLPGAEVDWTVSASPATFQPPNTEGFRFGEWTPWWWGYHGFGSGPATTRSLAGKTDSTGKHYIAADIRSVQPPKPYTLTMQGTVTDVNRQRWTSSTDVLVHPSQLYVGLRTERAFVDKGSDIDVDVLVVDVEGVPTPAAPVEVTLSRLIWKQVRGAWTEVEEEPTVCQLTSADEALPCSFTPKEGGTYQLRAVVHDGQERPNRTQQRIWVSGGDSMPQRGVALEAITLVPEGESFEVGSTAQVLVQSPFWPAEGVWSLRRNGLVQTHRFSMDGPSMTLEIPIEEAHVPNVYLDVDLVGSAVRTDDAGKPLPDAPRRVAQAKGSLDLKVPPLTRTLAVQVVPAQSALQPGGSTQVTIQVRDAKGEPVQAEVALVAVDEAVLSLSGYRVPDPIEVFYEHQGPGVAEVRLRDRVLLAAADNLAAPSSGDMGAAFKPEGEAVERSLEALGSRTRGASKSADSPPPPAPPPEAMPMAAMAMDEQQGGGSPTPGDAPIVVRKDFNATALFAPRVLTDATGAATVTLDVPDSLTRYRLMAVAVAGEKQFGSGESTVTARLPVMLRPSPPRFLNFGDRAELSLVVQNQTDTERSVDVAVQTHNVRVIDSVSAAPTGDPVRIAGRRTTVAAGDRVEVRIPIAAEQAGTARFQAVISSQGFSDATAFDLPVWTPATSEAFATYGVIDEGVAVQPVQTPGEVWSQFGGLDITTSSTNLQALTDALLYLVQYPFECNEQIASRILAVAALRDVLTAFAAEDLPSPEELEAAVQRDLERLERRQLGNGGFSFWRQDERDWPYLTVHVALALSQARAKGYTVPDTMWSRTLGYLRSIDHHIPSWYSHESRMAIRAYAVHVREQMGDADPKEAKALYKSDGLGLSMEALGWILPTLAADGQDISGILRHLNNNVAETAAGAHFVTSYGDGAYVLLHSDRRVDGVLLDALIRVQGDSDLIPKLVEGLLAHRKQGRWGNTQENAFVLLAMDRYFRTYEGTTPDFVARVWLGDTYAGDHTFKGRTTERANIAVPMAWLSDPGGTQDLIVQKDGAGRLYYRIGMTYAPKSLALEPADYGFTVLRAYEPIDDEGDVTRDADGTWHIKAGARVRVRLTMVAPARRYHVALVDPLPAGLEPQNPALAVTGDLPPDPQDEASRWSWWMRPWYEHQDMRDERVEAYTSLLWDGVWTYDYIAAATTPGEFVVPPAKAEEMYTPETFGRSGTDRVIVR